MKNIVILLFMFVTFAHDLMADVPEHLQKPEASGGIRVRILDLRNHDGEIMLLLFNGKKGFPGKEQYVFRKASIPAAGNPPIFKFEHIPLGSYALSVRHDENGNGKLDTNFIGMPKEGVGTSNNPRTRFGPPSFDDAKFLLDGDEKELVIHMRYL